jgi:hypothetical protein
MLAPVPSSNIGGRQKGHRILQSASVSNSLRSLDTHQELDAQKIAPAPSIERNSTTTASNLPKGISIADQRTQHVIA